MAKTKHKIINWENDLLDEPEMFLSEFVADNYPDYSFEMMSGFIHRDMSEVYESLKEARVIIMQPNLLEENQVSDMVKAISHPIHVNFNGASREWNIEKFIFLCYNPFDDLNTIKEQCDGVKDGKDSADALCKILHNCEIHFYGRQGGDAHYEMGADRVYCCNDIKAIRHK